MFVVKLFVDELVIDVNLPRTALIVLVEIIYGHIFDKVKAHLACKLSRSCIAFQTGNKFVNVLFVLLLHFGAFLVFSTLSLQRLLFSLILFKQADTYFFGDLTDNLIFIDGLDQVVNGYACRRACIAEPFRY